MSNNIHKNLLKFAIISIEKYYLLKSIKSKNAIALFIKIIRIISVIYFWFYLNICIIFYVIISFLLNFNSVCGGSSGRLHSYAAPSLTQISSRGGFFPTRRVAPVPLTGGNTPFGGLRIKKGSPFFIRLPFMSICI